MKALKRDKGKQIRCLSVDFGIDTIYVINKSLGTAAQDKRIGERLLNGGCSIILLL